LVVAAHADTRDVVIETLIRKDVDATKTNMAAGNGSVGSTKLPGYVPLSVAKL